MRPSASQIVSIASAPEFTHLLDVVSLAHNGNVLAGVGCPVANYDDDTITGHELWIPCSNSRIDLLLGSIKGWQQYHRILCPQIISSLPQLSHQQISNQTIMMKLTTVCIVETAVWIGDSDGNIHAFK